VSGEGAGERPEELAEEETADVEVFTSVRARELRFGAVPDTDVSFAGEPGVKSSLRTRRENLPDEVEPGVTYRDVKVLWGARAKIDHPTDP
jgi:hypothetical protein